ncbi:MAG TPA: hypothetical protein VMT90_02735 [Dehalococcoidia bacterium]|nr:hypothetical protein [Dehalococcoidia bacterium]
MKLFLGLCAVVAALVLLSGCSNTSGGGDLEVILNEWSITVDKPSLPEGPIDFTIRNQGTKDHDLVILRTDIPPDQLPTKSDGSVDTGAADVHEERKVEDLGDGDKTGRTYTLSAGNYVFIDNRVETEDSQKVSYYQQGMRVAFTVTKEGESPSPTSSPSGS